MKNIFLKLTAACLACLLALGAAGCAAEVRRADGTDTAEANENETVKEPHTGGSSSDLMASVKRAEVDGKAPDERFISAYADFAIKLFRKSFDGEKNTLISPLSVMLALAMTQNGARGDTRKQMETLLGGDIGAEELNRYLKSYADSLPSSEKARLETANSIWFRDEGFTPVNDFLQINADYYNASAVKAPFDSSTVADINEWVREHTDGMIDKILDRISAQTMMYLINAVVFDAEWEKKYSEYAISEREFRCLDGTVTKADMMYSRESLYLSGDGAEGFIKPYASGYYMAALLPDEGTDIVKYVDGLTGEKITDILKNTESGTVSAGLPKFSYEFELSMVSALKELGMTDAFDPLSADLSGLGSTPLGNLFVSDVVHKTFISVDEAGTRAGAVTSIEVTAESVPENYHIITLDRPFVYMIVDASTMLPVFIGAVTGISK